MLTLAAPPASATSAAAEVTNVIDLFNEAWQHVSVDGTPKHCEYYNMETSNVLTAVDQSTINDVDALLIEAESRSVFHNDSPDTQSFATPSYSTTYTKWLEHQVTTGTSSSTSLSADLPDIGIGAGLTQTVNYSNTDTVKTVDSHTLTAPSQTFTVPGGETGYAWWRLSSTEATGTVTLHADFSGDLKCIYRHANNNNRKEVIISVNDLMQRALTDGNWSPEDMYPDNRFIWASWVGNVQFNGTATYSGVSYSGLEVYFSLTKPTWWDNAVTVEELEGEGVITSG
ncbi:ETX/MTX2 family pore-forming toxin [Streptomyces actuosus]|uniref:ETX/MTX2 family pore-forming toxin n=1 Tax=Streptomyces actuosus TaxID=1885 RepID=A0ABS2W1Q1_STRAS|nr:ETX/MTX2 family pore-forming toxin [Streptomyces actuosus]MBN0049193.1 ETX/MTX2 family pore-forming toxin [Streptomyces actuosus]